MTEVMKLAAAVSAATVTKDYLITMGLPANIMKS